jgi:hypothetical protein
MIGWRCEAIRWSPRMAGYSKNHILTMVQQSPLDAEHN